MASPALVPRFREARWELYEYWITCPHCSQWAHAFAWAVHGAEENAGYVHLYFYHWPQFPGEAEWLCTIQHDIACETPFWAKHIIDNLPAGEPMSTASNVQLDWGAWH